MMQEPDGGNMAHSMIPDKAERSNLASWVDSAALKLLQYVVTLVLLPAVAWGLNMVVEKLSSIDARLAKSETINATVEVRINSIERVNDAQSAALQSIDSRLRATEGDVRSIMSTRRP